MTERKRMNQSWYGIFDEFALYFPAFAEQAVDWYPNGRSEIAIILEDGSVKYYNHLYRTIRYAKGVEEYKNETEEDLRRVFAKRLNDRMIMLGLTQYELAEMTGLSTVTLSKYMNGKTTPSLHNARKIERALKCSIYELVE